MTYSVHGYNVSHLLKRSQGPASSRMTYSVHGYNSDRRRSPSRFCSSSRMTYSVHGYNYAASPRAGSLKGIVITHDLFRPWLQQPLHQTPSFLDKDQRSARGCWPVQSQSVLALDPDDGS